MTRATPQPGDVIGFAEAGRPASQAAGGYVYVPVTAVMHVRDGNAPGDREAVSEITLAVGGALATVRVQGTPSQVARRINEKRTALVAGGWALGSMERGG